MPVQIETKIIGGTVVEVKQDERNGVPVGIIEGYIATWDVDRGDFWGIKDQFVRGAFADSILEHKGRNRQVRLKDHHRRTVGGFPIDTVREDAKGLFGVGEVNLKVQQGSDLHSLSKQGVLTDFSIGFSVDESSLDEQNDLRTITKATIWEGSVVDEPMNPFANITDVKSLFKEDDDIGTVIKRIRDYYYKNNPEMEKLAAFYNSENVQKFNKRDLEQILKATGMFSRNAAKIIASKTDFEGPAEEDAESSEEKNETLDVLRGLSGILTQETG